MNADNLIKLAEAAEEADNHEEAYAYFTRVLEADPDNVQAWFGKGVNAGWLSTLNRPRYEEMFSAIKRASAASGAVEGAAQAMQEAGASAIVDVVLAHFRTAKEHLEEYVALDDTWAEHVGRCVSMIAALRGASGLDPSNKAVLMAGVEIAAQLIEGIRYEDEFDTDSHGNSTTKVRHLPDEIEPEFRQILSEFQDKLRKLDPSIAERQIEKATDSNPLVAGCVIVLVLIVVGVVAFFAYAASKV